MMSSTRREFLTASAAMAAAHSELSRLSWPRAEATSVLLFQGDSITDAGRDRATATANSLRALGSGYPMMLTGALRERHPELDLQIYNRGVSGNTVDDLAARWETDAIALKPSAISILIGVNDIWHTRTGGYKGTPERYESGYAALLERTRRAVPGVKLIVLEPFVLRVGAVDATWFPEFDRYRAAAKRVANGASATFVELHEMFQKLAAKNSPAYWAADGVHPTIAGHAAIARQWQETVRL
jgi:lysophospholipase L1-like esterase